MTKSTQNFPSASRSNGTCVRIDGSLNERGERCGLHLPHTARATDKAIIRLEDGSQTAPFREGNTPNAYLPTAQGSDLPTVRQSLAAEGEVLSFLSRHSQNRMLDLPAD